MVGAQHAAPLRSRRPTALLPYPFTRREVDSMTTPRSVLIGTAIVAGLTAAIRRPAPAPGAGGTPAPELTNTSWLNSDKPLRLAELRGRVVLLNFWVSTCGNCTRTVPPLVAYDRRYRARGLTLVGIHTPQSPPYAGEHDKGNLARALDRQGITYPNAQDNDRRTWDAYSIRYWRSFVLIDKAGTIRYTGYGEFHLDDGDYQEWDRRIQQLLAESPLTLDAGPPLRPRGHLLRPRREPRGDPRAGARGPDTRGRVPGPRDGHGPGRRARPRRFRDPGREELLARGHSPDRAALRRAGNDRGAAAEWSGDGAAPRATGGAARRRNRWPHGDQCRSHRARGGRAAQSLSDRRRRRARRADQRSCRSDRRRVPERWDGRPRVRSDPGGAVAEVRVSCKRSRGVRARPLAHRAAARRSAGTAPVAARN